MRAKTFGRAPAEDLGETTKCFLIRLHRGAVPWPPMNERVSPSVLQRNLDHALDIFRGGHESCHLPQRPMWVLTCSPEKSGVLN